MSESGPRPLSTPFNPLFNVEEMARMGLAYDFSGIQRERPPQAQKQGGKRNKNNRRDHKRFHKEVSMGGHTETSRSNNNRDRESAHRLPSDSGIDQIVDALQRGNNELISQLRGGLAPLGQLDVAMQGLTAATKSLTEGAGDMKSALVEFKSEVKTLAVKVETAEKAAIETKAEIVALPAKTVQEANKFLSMDNLKGDVRTGLVVHGMAGLVALVAWGVSAIFFGGSSGGAAGANANAAGAQRRAA